MRTIGGASANIAERCPHGSKPQRERGNERRLPAPQLLEQRPPRRVCPALLQTFGSSKNISVTWTRFKWPELASDLKTGPLRHRVRWHHDSARAIDHWALHRADRAQWSGAYSYDARRGHNRRCRRARSSGTTHRRQSRRSSRARHADLFHAARIRNHSKQLGSSYRIGEPQRRRGDDQHVRSTTLGRRTPRNRTGWTAHEQHHRALDSP